MPLPGKAVDEVAWATASGRQARLVQAVVAFADLTAADVGDLLDRELAYPPCGASASNCTGIATRPGATPRSPT